MPTISPDIQRISQQVRLRLKFERSRELPIMIDIKAGSRLDTPIKTRLRLISLFWAASAFLLIASPAAKAGYIVTLQQVGPNIVATGRGAIDVTGLNVSFPSHLLAGQINATNAHVLTGPVSNFDLYTGSINGPANFGLGTGTPIVADHGTGDLVGIAPDFGTLYVATGYVSGTPVFDTSVYFGETFSNLGVTPGTYVWTWGTGVNQNFTLQIPAPSVPDSGSTLGLFFLDLLALVGARRLRVLRSA